MSSAAVIQDRIDAFVASRIGGGPLESAFDEALRRRRAIDDGAPGLAESGLPAMKTHAGDPWIRRRGGRGGGDGVPAQGLGSSGTGSRQASGRVARAFAGARGQAAVIKIKSYASGVERVKASARYVGAAAEHVAEKDDGAQLVGPVAVNAVLDRWERDYFATAERRETQDTVSLTLAVAGDVSAGEAAIAFASALEGHRYAFAVSERSGQSALELVATLQSAREVTYTAKPTLGAPQGAIRTTRVRLRPTERAMSEVAGSVAQALGRSVAIRAATFHHGEPETLKALARLAHGGERAIATDAGLVLRAQDERLSLAQGWRRFMASRQTRDTMHLIVSSRPGTDRAAFVAATRSWLKDTFGRHEYLFTVHDNTAHTHVHALIVMRTRDRYERLKTSPAVLQAWRERFAERAREQGIAMFAERRLAQGQARPTSWGRGERAERSPAPHVPERETEAGLMAAAQAEWVRTLRTIEMAHAREPGAEAAKDYARGVVARLEAGLAAWRSQSRNNEDEKTEVSARGQDGSPREAAGDPSGPWPATLASIDGLIRKVEDGMVTETQARQALRDTHSRIMRLAVMSRSAETRARFTAIANDIHDRGNEAVTVAVERRQAELERARSATHMRERDSEQQRTVTAHEMNDRERSGERDVKNEPQRASGWSEERRQERDDRRAGNRAKDRAREPERDRE
jgi:hypothetical protein